jgi:flagellar biosynthesis/type III secretory pathway protein FliH
MFNPVEAVNESTRLTKRLVQVNVDYARDLAGAVRKHVTGLVDIMNDEVLTSARLVNHQAEKLEEAALEEAEQIEQAERAEAQRARKAAHDAAVERYQEMTKVELSEELGKRELPRTGNVDVLRDRLIDDDLKVQP